MAAIDLAALAAELTNDPAALGYAGKTTDEIYALLQTPQSVECFVSLKDLQSKLMETVVAPATVPVWWVLKGAAASNPLAGMVFDLFSPAASRLENFNTRGAFQQYALAQLLAAGLIDQALLDWVNSKATKMVARGEVLFGRMPTAFEIALAQTGG